MILLALAVFGIVSIYDVNIEFMSDINIPQVYVISVYPGASSQDIEETVIDVMEDNFVTLEGFSSMESQASNSVGVVILSFQDGYDARKEEHGCNGTKPESEPGSHRHPVFPQPAEYLLQTTHRIRISHNSGRACHT